MEQAEVIGVERVKTMDKDNKIPLTFRLPESLYDWSKQEAERIGIAQNALLLYLIDEGRKMQGMKLAITRKEQEE